jgi:hypothetical protein
LSKEKNAALSEELAFSKTCNHCSAHAKPIVKILRINKRVKDGAKQYHTTAYQSIPYDSTRAFLDTLRGEEANPPD